MRTGDPGDPGAPGETTEQGEAEAREAPSAPADAEVPGEPNVDAADGPAGEDDPAAVAEATAEPDPAEIIATLERDKKEVYDRWVRTTADFENYRKRAQRESEDRARRSREEVLKAVLPIADNLERALDHADEANSDSIHEGVRLVHRQFLGALQQFDVQPFESVGVAFNPEEHDAVGQEETAEVPPGCVVREMQRGYLIGDRVLRPAMVTVARPPSPPEKPATQDDATQDDAAQASKGSAEGGR